MLSRFWRRLGPGILLAATSIGASHLVHSPRAGALFGFQLLWLILASHLFKYPAFEFGPRYAAATGQHLLAGYARVPGPRGWALYLFLVSTVVQGVGVLAGVVNVSGCVLATWVGDPDAVIFFGLQSVELFSLAVVALVVVLLFAGGFRWLEHLNKIMMAILAAATVLAFIPVAPGPSALARLVVPSLPDGSIILVAAILGWMPTGIDVSVWHSFWTLEKLELLGEGAGRSVADLKRRLAISLGDMRVGYLLSLVTGLMFVSLGAAHLGGLGAELRGVQFAQAISTAYTAILGRWMYYVFMLTAFFAMFSTSYVVVDGFSRSFAETLATLRPGWAREPVRSRAYGWFVVGSSVFAGVAVIGVGNPITLVTIASLISLAAAPVLYGLNCYCVGKHITQPELQPARITLILGWVGTGFMLLALGLTMYLKLGGLD